MAYFIPSSIQKRLLRYALSRLELLDTDALDLERLDIAWGRRSTIDLQDVGLQRDKLSALLSLPASLTLVQAKVGQLRLTVPADLHTSSVVVEISKVEVHFRLDEDEGTSSSQISAFEARKGITSKGQRRRRGRRQHDAKDALPNTEELAKSFLGEETPEERAQLEAAWSSQSVDLAASVASIDAGSDGSSNGMGMGFGLPAFLASFLRGVGDRLQVGIKEVTVKLDVLLDLPEESRSTPTTICIVIDEIGVHEADTAFTEASRNISASLAGDQPISKRRITLDGLNGFLIADVSTLHLVSQVLDKGKDVPSPAVTHHFDGVRPDLEGSIGDATLQDSKIPTGFDRVQSPRPRLWEQDVTDSMVSVESDVDDGFMSTLAGRAGDNLDRDLEAGSVETSQAFDQSPPFAAMQDSLTRFREKRRPRPTMDRSQVLRRRRSISPLGSPQNETSRMTASSPPVRHIPWLGPSQYPTRDQSPMISMPPIPSPDSQPTSPNETPFNDDLIQSQYFSHEEAQSIYMSAVHGIGDSPCSSRRMPGQWQDADDQTQVMASNSDKLPSVASTKSHATPPAEVRATSSEPDGSSRGPSLDACQPPPGASMNSDSSGSQASTLSKRCILDISSIQVCLSEHPRQADDDQTPSLEQSTHRQAVPGSFSRYADSTPNLRHSGGVHFEEPPLHHGDHDHRSNINRINVDVGDTTILADPVSCKLAAQICKKLQTALLDGNDSGARPSPKTETTDRDFRVTLKKILFSFIESSIDGPIRDVDDSKEAAKSTGDGAAGLLEIELLNSSLHLLQQAGPSKGKCDIGIASVALHGQHIVSFAKESMPKSSTKNWVNAGVKDIAVDFGERNGSSDVNIWLQPLEVRLPMHEIDGALESIGGLSGLLELGSSMMSDTTVVNRQKSQPPAPRSVRFEASTKFISEEPSGAEVKVNIRLAGANVRLLGESCSIAARTTAITAISRKAGLRVQINECVFGCPEPPIEQPGTGLSAKGQNIRLRYLFAPEEHDLTRLIRLLTPSNDRFEEEDDFLVDTLIRQRRKGAVLRVEASKLEVNCNDTEDLTRLRNLSEELSKLSAVTKYLPQESRPGLLTLASVDQTALCMITDTKLGDIRFSLNAIEVAQVSAPGLIASAADVMHLRWGAEQTLISPLIPDAATAKQPMIMLRMIEDELEPTLKIKLWNTCVDYSVDLLMACNESDLLSGSSDGSATQMVDPSGSTTSPRRPEQAQSRLANSSPNAKQLRIDAAFRDCAVGLNPRGLPSKALFMLNQAKITGGLPDDIGSKVNLDLRKVEVLIIDDVTKIQSTTGRAGRTASTTGTAPISRDLCRCGYVNVCTISAATIAVLITNKEDSRSDSKFIEVDVSDELFLLETCADSTQTLFELLGSLQSPSPPSTSVKYRTEIAPVEDLMASFLGDAYAVPLKKEYGLGDEATAEEDEDDAILNAGLDDADFEAVDDGATLGDDLRFEPGDDALEESIYSGLGLSQLHSPPLGQSAVDEHLSGTVAAMPAEMQASIMGSLSTAQLSPQIYDKAKRFDSTKNKYIAVSKHETQLCPIKIHVKELQMIWHMYDGYDWEKTRDVITQAVEDVEARAEGRRKSRRAAVEKREEDDESVIGDCLFNSIYVALPTKSDPKDLARHINHDIDDLVSETASRTASNAPSHTSTATSRPSSAQKQRPRTPASRLKLNRSKRHKISIELRGLSADYYAFPPGGETQSSTDIRVQDFEIFDHVPTSTWKKFLTYMHDAGPREDNKPMVHLEICEVRPVPELTATELVVRAILLPLRLHVDQDALDFVTRFFAFKDNDKPVSETTSEQPFLQRVEVLSIPVKLDYKPHRVDFAGLRSGRTKEFMNFVILDGSDFILKHVCLYGISGLEKLHEMLDEIWMADVKSPQQLPNVLAGLNGVRTLINMGTGLRDLVQIPIREYKKDGRLVRSISKGAFAFGRTTGGELTRLGAKLAVNAQRALQGAEGVLLGPQSRQYEGWEDADLDAAEKRAFSHYANQPIGIVQGLKGAARSLERDLLITRDVVIAISGEIRESNSMEGAARAVVRHSPTLILRPMIGASKAVSQTMMGATNTVDPANRRRIEDVSIITDEVQDGC